MSNKLVRIVEESGLEPTKAKIILDKFVNELQELIERIKENKNG